MTTGVRPAPVLLLHGFTGSAEAWGTEILEPLRARGPVIAVDLPGHGAARPGGSSHFGDPERFRIHCVVKEVVRALDEAGVERADWVGYSMGGRVALAAAVLRPGRVRRLVLESASPGIRDEAERAARRAEDEALAREIETRGIEWFVERWEGHPLFAREGAGPGAAQMRAVHLRNIRLRNDPTGLAAALRGYGAGAQPSFWDRLGEIQAPTLLLTGSEDPKYRAIAEEMAGAIGGAGPGAAGVAGEGAPSGGAPAGGRARHLSLPGVGHAVHREAPEAWVREVVGFLG